MSEYTVEELLAAVFEGDWPADANLYDLNVLLRLKPWWPPLPAVWSRRDLGPDWHDDGPTWQAALALLHELHAKYLAAGGES